MLRLLAIAGGAYAVYRHLTRNQRGDFRSTSPVADQTANLGTPKSSNREAGPKASDPDPSLSPLGPQV